MELENDRNHVKAKKDASSQKTNPPNKNMPRSGSEPAEWFWKTSWNAVGWWFLALTAVSALVVASIALNKVLRTEGRVPEAPEGNDNSFLVGSKQNGISWSNSMVIPAQVNSSTKTTQALHGINFGNPIGGTSTAIPEPSDIFPENTLSDFGSVDHEPVTMNKTDGSLLNSTGTVLNSIALKSDFNQTAIVQLGGQLLIDTGGLDVQPKITEFDLQSQVLEYGAVNFALGQTAAAGSIVHFYCTIENGEIEFWQIDNTGTTSAMTVNSAGLPDNQVVISFLVHYPLKFSPTTSPVT